ncbi:hypothetical protein [Amycolatopsis sp. GM8]|uniref:hypothetical protein n=1 Tax=Amycolatopsis sp. GM8 TaxID=2896530 RepID=UPI001F32FFB1|nr:hypothetical protein [Amycolatopsis sp. GM8]
MKLRGIRKAVLATVLAGTAALGGVATADAATGAPSANVNVGPIGVGVSAVGGAPIQVRRDIPNLPMFYQPAVGPHAYGAALPGSRWWGQCWTEGQWITDFGVTNNAWIRVSPWAGNVFYFWAGALRGDAHAGVPNHC